jgi:hypothetical protein
MTLQTFKELYKDKIFWYDEPEPIDEYLNIIKGNILDLDLNIDIYKELLILGVYNTNIYIISNKEYDTLYISVGECSPLFWYKFTDLETFMNEFTKIYEAYNPIEYPSTYQCAIKSFMGNENMLELNVHDIENHFILQKYTDKLIWGSLWKIHPFRKEYLEGYLSYIDSIIYTGQAMRQTEGQYTISVLSSYSKSMITIHDYEEAFIIEVKYNPINTPQNEQINNLFGRGYKMDIPIDVILVLINFPFITHSDILKMRPFTLFHFYIVLTLIDDNPGLIDEVIPIFKELLSEINKEEQKDLSDEINNYLKFIQK